MPRRLWVSLGALAIGTGLLATAQLAGATRGSKAGGIFRVGIAGSSVQIDPQLAYTTTAWWLEYATAAKLFNYRDRRGEAGNRLVPEVASRFTVSRDERTYTFFVRQGFRFSDGSPVTARSFAYAIDRAANHELASPAAAFITDPSGTEIVGAKAVDDGRATHVSGVVARGNRLVIRLVRPDNTLPSKLALPFFQATSTKLPLSREVETGYPSAGPYVFAQSEPNALTELRRNGYYRGRRPHHLDGVDVSWNVDQRAAYQDVLAGRLDEGPVPDADARAVAKTYGVNRTRFWVEPTSCLGFLAFNNDRPLFRNNAALRRAINWVVDRRAALAAAPPYSGSPWTHLLPPGSPGSITAKRLQPYGTAPQPAKARRIAAGHLRSGNVTVGYRGSAAAQARLLRDDLIGLGFRPDRITLTAVSGADLYRATNLDIGVGLGWCSDFPLETFPAPASLQSSPRFRRLLAAAERLRGEARFRAIGKLDIALMNDLAPVAVMRTYDNRYFFSARVDRRTLVYESVYSDWSIPALALK